MMISQSAGTFGRKIFICATLCSYMLVSIQIQERHSGLYFLWVDYAGETSSELWNIKYI